jgi:uncharacterized membrane-anchored protein YjiN (DUF445 family)
MTNDEKELIAKFTELWFEHDGTHFYKNEWQEFILAAVREAVKRERGDVIGKIGASLLAKHSHQAILDAYFDSANEILEQNESNN